MPAWIAPVVGGLLGGMGGKNKAKSASRPTRTSYSNTSQLTPYGGSQYIDPYLGNMLPGAYNNMMGALPQGPNPFSLGAASQLAGNLFGGFELPGVHVPQLGEAPLAGIPDAVWEKLNGGFGVGLGATGIKKVTMSPEEIARFMTDIPPELRQIAAGQFLSANDPLLDAVIRKSAEDANESFAMSVNPAINSQFSLAGRSGSGAHAMAQAYANQQQQEQIQNMAAQQRLAAVQAEKQRQMQALGLEGELHSAARGNLTAMRNTDQQVGGQLAAVSAQNRLQSALGAAGLQAQLAQANAAMKAKYDLAQAGFDMQGSALGLQSAIQAAQLEQAGLASLFNMGQGLYANERQAAIDPFAMTMQYGQAMLPYLTAFGRQTQSGYGTNTPPKQSGKGGFLGGAMQGALGGFGLNNMFGWGGGGGGGALGPGGSFYDNFTPAGPWLLPPGTNDWRSMLMGNG